MNSSRLTNWARDNPIVVTGMGCTAAVAGALRGGPVRGARRGPKHGRVAD